ncbi:MAG: hypothetical protein ABIP12_00220 [Terriglobales bacterium]
MRNLLVTAAAMVLAAWMQQPQEASRRTYLNGEPVAFEIAQTSGKEKAASFGPWKLGAKVVESKPHDTRLNLYIVAPGDDFRSDSDAASIYDHNRVINMAPKEKGSAEFDVYWAIALEPHVDQNFHSEADLLEAVQRRFVPGDLFEIKDAPGAGFLREVLRIDTLEELKPYRRKDGSLPTVLLVPAGFAVRGGIQP